MTGAYDEATVTIIEGISANCFPAPSDKVVWWRGEGDAMDWANGNNSTVSGDVTYSAGRVGSAINFGSTGGHIQSTISTPTLDDFTVEGWVRLDTPSDPVSRLFRYFNSGQTNYLDILVTSDGTLRVENQSSTLVNSHLFIADGNWHHIAVSAYGNGIRIFVDGEMVGAELYSGTLANLSFIRIGEMFMDNRFVGSVDEIAFYRRGLRMKRSKEYLMPESAANVGGLSAGCRIRPLGGGLRVILTIGLVNTMEPPKETSPTHPTGWQCV